MFSKFKNVLIIASHPDDEILGCGGTIAKLLKERKNVYVYFTHEGSSSRFSDPEDSAALIEVGKRKKMAINSSKLLGYKIINKIKPEIIFTHHPEDMNEDHFYTYKIVINSTRPTALHLVKQIYLMEIPSSTDWAIRSTFKPNLFINIEKYLNIKIKALKMYFTEYQKYPLSRSHINLKSHSIYRGAQVGLKNVEAFEIYRIVN